MARIKKMRLKKNKKISKSLWILPVVIKHDSRLWLRRQIKIWLSRKSFCNRTPNICDKLKRIRLSLLQARAISRKLVWSFWIESMSLHVSFAKSRSISNIIKTKKSAHIFSTTKRQLRIRLSWRKFSTRSSKESISSKPTVTTRSLVYTWIDLNI